MLKSILLLNFFIAKSLLSLTCAEELEKQAGILSLATVCAAGSINLPAYACGSVTILLAANAYAQAKILRAASIISTDGAPSKILAKANRVIDFYYKRLGDKYPNMQLLKSDLVEFLHLFNLNAKDNPNFNKISWGKGKLYKYAFPKNMLKPSLEENGDFSEDSEELPVYTDPTDSELQPIFTRREVKTV